ncbi:MAG TPA: hypothetical protein VF614_03345 [Chthoniobacteraceae bacterium]|jgi:hypothetical protein
MNNHQGTKSAKKDERRWTRCESGLHYRSPDGPCWACIEQQREVAGMERVCGTDGFRRRNHFPAT